MESCCMKWKARMKEFIVVFKTLGSPQAKEIRLMYPERLLGESRFFATVVKWNNPNGNNDPTTRLEVHEDVPYETFCLFLRLLQSEDAYSDLIDLPLEDIIAVNFLSDKYMCRNLELDTVAVYLGRLCPENAVLMCAATVDAVWNQNLFLSAQKVFEKDTEKALNDSALECPTSVLMKLFSSDSLNLNSEAGLFHFLDRWRKHSTNVNDARELLSTIRLFSLKAPEFLDGPAASDLLTNEEKFAFFQYKETDVLPNDYSLNRVTTGRLNGGGTWETRSVKEVCIAFSSKCSLFFYATPNIPVRLTKVCVELQKRSGSENSALINDVELTICDFSSFVLATLRNGGVSSAFEWLVAENGVHLLGGERHAFSISVQASGVLPFDVLEIHAMLLYLPSSSEPVHWDVEQV